MKIAFLGTGLMGAPMARHLAAVHDVTVWNRSEHKAKALGDVCNVRATPQEAVKGAECVISMLLDGPATRAVLDNLTMHAAAKGGLIIDMGSVDPDTDRALARQSESIGLAYLDAPVSGGVTGAEAASLAILVGGSKASFLRATPVFNLLGRATHLGEVGAGQVAKLANQLIVATTIGAVAEAMRLAEAGGCDKAALRDALRGGFADSRILDLHGARMVEGNFTPGGRSVAQLKDLNNAMTLAHTAGLSLPLSETITAGFRDFVEVHNGGEKDHSAYYEWLDLKRN
ncbi:NAD(P)-dependent oxidoreductase [Falsihalocynthiibacter sp. S25ZX9]|uniref:NAD(P)-dependent oxidoreductase n=1 Tax=unclassified Falsihalocynthiibacter TaxID=2854191 RepID=UPI00350EDB1F